MSSSRERPALIIVMGTSGCGKSTVGLSLAELLEVPFVDGDDLHPQSNIDKMSSGTPLTDEDRKPWLQQIRQTAIVITHSPNPDPSLTKIHPESLRVKRSDDKRKVVVIACSALKKPYRDILRGKAVQGLDDTEDQLETFFLYLHGTHALLLNRMQHRPGHFFKPAMLDSQFAALEEPSETEEDNVRWVKLGKGPEETEEIGIVEVGQVAMKIASDQWGLGVGHKVG